MATMPRRDFTLTALAAVAAPHLRAKGANDRLSLGLIGCGSRSGSLTAEAQKLAGQHNLEFTACCDIWRPARERCAARFREWSGKAPRVFSRYADLLALDDLDAVIIATPDFAHAPILKAAAEAGKGAYCEKPMANRLDDAVAAVKAVEAAGVIVQIGTQRRSEGRFRAAAKFIQSGVLGKISHVRSQWHDSGPRWERGFGDVKEEDVDWEQFQLDLPRRPFDPRRFRCWHLYLDYTSGTPGLLGSHMIDTVTWFMNDPVPRSCVAHGGVYVWPNREHADTLECLYEYPGGWLLNYSTRLGNSSAPAEAVFYGTKGSFDTSSWTATGVGGGRDKLTEEVKFTPEPSESHVGNWLACLRSGQQPNCTVRDGLHHSVAAIMADTAWRTGRRQVFDPATLTIKEG